MKVSSVELAELEYVISGIDTPVLRDRFRTEHAAGRIPVVKDIEVFYRWFVYHRACDDGFRFENVMFGTGANLTQKAVKLLSTTYA